MVVGRDIGRIEGRGVGKRGEEKVSRGSRGENGASWDICRKE